MKTLHWFRSDLRLDDNTALHHAARSGACIAVYIIAPTEWRAHDVSALQVDLRLRAAAAVSARLAAKNIPLKILRSKAPGDVPALLLRLARALEVDALHFNREYEFDEVQRDAAVTAAFTQAGITVRAFTDQTLLDPLSFRTTTDKPYTVFTPFKRNFLKRLEEFASGHTPQLVRAPARQDPLDIHSDPVPASIPGFDARLPDLNPATLFPATEAKAQAALADFIANHGRPYKTDRDFPSIRGTSRLSFALAVGLLSPKQCFLAAAAANSGAFATGNLGLTTWISELIWREFYVHVTASFPRVVKGRAFKIETERLAWRNDPEQFEAWCEGRTGYPLVDAGMRQLHALGWMHNRLRMVTAMFLSKHLLLDWRLGEKHFMNNLIDCFFASNNGSWQWSASTGVDAAPYFRILSPLRQSLRFDPDGAFIRQFVPELASLNARDIHDPSPAQRKSLNYPMPIVDHVKARARVLAAFKALR